MFRVSVISRVVSESSSDFDYLRLRELDRPYKDKTSQGLQWNQAPFSALAIAADSLATPLGWTALDPYLSIDLRPCSGRSWRLWHVARLLCHHVCLAFQGHYRRKLRPLSTCGLVVVPLCGLLPPLFGQPQLILSHFTRVVGSQFDMWLTMVEKKLRCVSQVARHKLWCLLRRWGVLKHQPSYDSQCRDVRKTYCLIFFSPSCLTTVHTPALNKPLSEAGPRPLLNPCTRLQYKRLMPVHFRRRHARAEARRVRLRQACLPHKSPPSRSTQTGAP